MRRVQQGPRHEGLRSPPSRRCGTPGGCVPQLQFRAPCLEPQVPHSTLQNPGSQAAEDDVFGGPGSSAANAAAHGGEDASPRRRTEEETPQTEEEDGTHGAERPDTKVSR